MASESSDPENSFVERLISSRNRDLSILFPLLLGIMGAPQATEAAAAAAEEEGGGEDSDGETDRIILINPFTQAMIVVEGGGGRRLEAIFREISESGRAPPPASKSSIEAMPRVEALEEGEECAICLEEMAAEAREMPCRHRYHSNCIEKWLGLHGSCPVCRFKMPVEEVEEGKKRGGGEEGEEGGRRRRREIWVSFSVNRRDSSATTE